MVEAQSHRHAHLGRLGSEQLEQERELGSFAIAGTASLAVVWNKRENDMKAKQIQSLNGSSLTPTALELESLPWQKLRMSTMVKGLISRVSVIMHGHGCFF